MQEENNNLEDKRKHFTSSSTIKRGASVMALQRPCGGQTRRQTALQRPCSGQTCLKATSPSSPPRPHRRRTQSSTPPTSRRPPPPSVLPPPSLLPPPTLPSTTPGKRPGPLKASSEAPHVLQNLFCPPPCSPGGGPRPPGPSQSADLPLPSLPSSYSLLSP